MEVLLDIVVICSHFSIFETLETTKSERVTEIEGCDLLSF